MSRATWHTFEQAFDDRFCNDVINIADQYEWESARTFSSEVQIETRSANIKWLNPGNERSITEAIYHMASVANMQTFGINIQGCFELQFTSYDTGDFYKEHIDVPWRKDRGAPKFDRKLSCSILLNDPAEFEGGELIVDGDKMELNHRGSMTVFPSYIPHEVKPVTKGKRLSLVSWIAGPEWR